MRGKKTAEILIGVALVCLGNIGFFIGAALGVIHAVFFKNNNFYDFIQSWLWYSALPVVIGTCFVGFGLFFSVRRKRAFKTLMNEPIANANITVVLTAYNDELSIGGAVHDFLNAKGVIRVIVISNNSSDNTLSVAKEAGAIVFNETLQGYGACVYRALREACLFDDTEIICLCEGDLTFRSYDLPKFLAYLPHADVVNGTRIVEQLQESATQLSMFMHYGNFAVAKLLECKYLSDATLSDVGTTYKVMRKTALQKIMPKLNPHINLEFNPYFLETAISSGLAVLECPITFHPRVGESKGGNRSNWIAMKLGMRMIYGIFFGWNRLASNVR